jgi:ATP-dependent Clp protease protease subunit
VGDPRLSRPQGLIPFVIEQTPRGERQHDIFSALHADRIVFLGNEVDYDSANLAVAQMLYLEKESYEEPIHLYINSVGGSVTGGLAIYDVMQFVRCPVYTYCVGLAASIAAVILAGGSKGSRYVLPNGEILIHQPWMSGLGGQATDIEIHTRQLLHYRHRINEILAECTGQPIEQIQKDTDRDRYMSAEQSVEYGLVDKIITRPPSEDGDTQDENDEGDGEGSGGNGQGPSEGEGEG